MKFIKILTAFCVGAVAVMAQGNIVITGHDDDYHWSADGGITTPAGVQLVAMFHWARGTSTKPVLTFDAGTELTNALTAAGIPFTNVNPDTGTITDSMFSTATYSAIGIASDSTCGGCDNDPTGEANIAAHKTAIGNFLNAGGGIVSFAGANSPNYYAELPQTPSSVGGAPSTGYVATAAGISIGIPADNFGDATHNLFYPPGTNGESASFQVIEQNTVQGNGTIAVPAAVTLACISCTVSGTTLGSGTPTTPVPSSVLLLGIGLAALAAFSLAKKFAAR
jgi:hypothetical protein